MTPPTPPKPAGGTIYYVDSVPCTEYTTPFRVSTRREKKSRKDENGRGRGCGLLEGPRAADLPSSSLKPGGGARTNKLGRRFALPLFPICHRTQSRTAYRHYPPRHTHPHPPRRTPLFFLFALPFPLEWSPHQNVRFPIRQMYIVVYVSECAHVHTPVKMFREHFPARTCTPSTTTASFSLPHILLPLPHGRRRQQP